MYIKRLKSWSLIRRPPKVLTNPIYGCSSTNLSCIPDLSFDLLECSLCIYLFLLNLRSFKTQLLVRRLVPIKPKPDILISLGAPS